MATRVDADGSMQNVLPFTRHTEVKQPQPCTPSEMPTFSDYEMMRDFLKELNADLAALKQKLHSLRG